MTGVAHEAFVARRFDAVASRFRSTVEDDDVRLRAVIEGLGVEAGQCLLDVGCGKGRFAERLASIGAEVVGIDASAAMLASAGMFCRVHASARRLPFADRCFGGAYAIEVFEHLSVEGLDATLGEIARVVRPGGRVVVIDKNRAALDARRPWLPAVVVKRIDERRGRWMYRPGEPVRERWFSPSGLARVMARRLDAVRYQHLLRTEETHHAIFRLQPSARLFVAWTGVVR